ncbi:hypothetical protein GX51_07942 [Blastomyces parvus]|uniref:Uncharacterized protein n=1 Tax=Blastomyces parvus TaxID=2060905 RepID=A0A2B7WI49_9EURO|nr:hypothetical protein GX51_07942 [Blastomyces parvus]
MPALGGNADRAVTVEPPKEKCVLAMPNVGISTDAIVIDHWDEWPTPRASVETHEASNGIPDDISPFLAQI